MKNLIPHFIADRFKEGIYKGKFNAVTMFMDISGFTPMTERLMKEGKEGAEVLSSILNNIFTPVVASIYSRQGFISLFAGDALTAIFPSDNYITIIFSALEINKIFKEQGLQKTRFGDFELSVKLGLSFGNVDWGILGTDSHKTFYFRGEAIDGCAKSEHHCNKMDIVLDNKIYQKVSSSIEAHSIDENLFLLDKIAIDEHKQAHFIEQKHLDEKVLSLFVPKELIDYTQKGEFRNIVSVFISFKEPDNFDELNAITSLVIDKIDNFGGYFNKIDFGDKGGTMLVFFGFPVSYENNVKRAVNFILTLKEKFGDVVRAGLTTDIAYSGFVGSDLRCEYTCLGDVVNLSARFMMKAAFGQLWISKAILDKVKEAYNTKDLGAKEFKGKSEPISVFELLEVKHKRAMKFFEGEMIGRQKEYEELKSHCKTILNGKFGGVVYVYGEVGIGKSRLVYEATESLRPDVDIYNLQADSILKHSMNPFSYFLNSYFRQYQGKTDEERKKLFEQTYDAMLSMLSTIQDDRIEELIKELKRTKSIIGATIGLHWEGSLYEQLDPKGRYENTLFAIKSFFKAHSLIRPLIILIEDLQWVDSDSMECFKILTRNIADYPIIVIATSRINDDGTKPKLVLEKEVPQSEINIEYLTDDAIGSFIENQLKNKQNNDLTLFIKSKLLGNPFYIEQFCLYLLENKLIEIIDGLYRLTKRDVEIPVGINSIIIARIDRLSFDSKELVQMASVLGREVETTVLFELIKLSKNVIDKDKFIELVNKCENEQIWTILSEIKYIFKHALLRDVVYDMQLRERLRTLHMFAAEIIEQLYEGLGEKYSEIAYHFDKGEEFDKAKIYYEKAGDYFKDNFKNQEAIRQYERLLKILTDKNKIVEILNKKSAIFDLIGKWDIAEETYKKSIIISTEIGDKKLIGESKRLLGWIIKNKGRCDDAMTLFVDAKSLAEEIEDKKLYSAAIGNMGIAYYNKSDYDNAMKCYEEQKQICLEIGDRLGYSIAVGSMGIVYKETGNYDNAMKCYDEKKQICLEIGDRRGYSAAIGNMGNVYSDKGDYDNAMKCYDELKQICLEIGDRRGYSAAVGNMGIVYHNKSNYDNAMKCYDEKKQICLEIGDRRGYSAAVGNMGNVHSDKGDYDNAMECYEEQKQICLEIGDRRGYSSAAGNIGIVYYNKSDYDNAMKYYDEAIQIGRELGVKYYLCGYLNNKAKLLFDMNRFYEAKLTKKEALQISTEVEREDVIFDTTILKHKIDRNIDALKETARSGDLETAGREKKERQGERETGRRGEGETTRRGEEEKTGKEKEKMKLNDEQMATIHYELWKMTSEKEHSEKAIDLYKQLYEKTPKYEFKKRIEEMKE